MTDYEVWSANNKQDVAAFESFVPNLANVNTTAKVSKTVY